MKRRDSILLSIISLCLTGFVIAYMGYHAVMAFQDPLQTVSAVQFTVEDTVPVSGYFIRDERLIPYPEDLEISGGVTEACVSDGTRVAKDDAIFRIYANQSAPSVNSQLYALERRISEMEYAQSQAMGAIDTAHLDLMIYQRLSDVLDSRDRRRQVAFENQLLEFKSLVFKREYTYGEGSNLITDIALLKEQAESLRNGQIGEVYELRSPVSGIFTAQADGYEQTLTPEVLRDITVEDYMSLADMRSSVDKDTSMGKLALGFEWYHVILLPAEEAVMLKEGGSIALRFSNAGYSEVRFKVERISDASDGQCVVVLSSTYNIADYINSRRMPADLVLRTFSGLRVPRNAIWFDSAAQDFGVYCVVGNQVTFKQVEILTERDNYYLVAFDPLDFKPSDLLPGDEMITEGKDLYDGKVYLQSE